MITVDPGYWLMPEANAETMTHNIRAFCDFLFDKLGGVLARINPVFTIAWDEIFFFGISFGAYMALGAFREVGLRTTKPQGLCIRAIVLRCPLLRMYHREAGEFMGIKISKSRATQHSEAVWKLRQELPFVVQRTGCLQPAWYGMFFAHTASVSGIWKRFWGAQSMYEIFAGMPTCPDDRTQVIIWHGTADKNVAYTDLEDFKSMWDGKGWRPVTLELHADKPHAWDYKERLSSSLRALLQRST